MLPFLDQIITGIITFLLGGGLMQLIKARREARMHDAQASSLEAKTGVEVTDISMSTLMRVNEQLGEDYARVKSERDDYYGQIAALRIEVEALRQMAQDLQDKLDEIVQSHPIREEPHYERTTE